MNIIILFAIEYLAESALELRYGFLDALSRTSDLDDHVRAQIQKILPADYRELGIEAVDGDELQAEIKKAAAVFAATYDLVPMLGQVGTLEDEDRIAVEAVRDKRSRIQRCAEYAQRAQSGSAEAQSRVLARLALELSALVE
jgi:hypothetical protein